MKKICMLAVICLVCSLPMTLNAEDLKVGYKDFMLGQSRDEVKSIITKNYSGGTVKYYTGGDVLITPEEMIQVYLHFDHKNSLYKIHVQLKYGELAQVKKRLVDKYGQPNDYNGDEFDAGNKVHLMGRWLVEKQFRISLWESEYCRNQKMIPCTIEVDYLDIKRKDDKDIHDRNSKENIQKSKDAKTYDGF